MRQNYSRLSVLLVVLLSSCGPLAQLRSDRIFDAIAAGDTSTVRNLLTSHPELIRAKKFHGETPLHLAALYYTQPGIVELLLEEGADVNALTSGEETPLHMAVALDRHEMVRLLLRNGADINASDGRGRTPLQKVGDSKNMAELLLTKGADVNTKDKKGRTPLHYASYSGRIAIVECLLVSGADVNAKDSEGVTPLRLASASGVRKILLRHGAHKGYPQPLGIGASIYTEVESGDVEAVRAQLDLDPGLINSTNEQGEPLLYRAATNCDKEMAGLLLARGAFPNAKTSYGSTPLHIASLVGCIEVLEILVEYHADVNAVGSRDRTAETPLHCAAGANQRTAVRFLIAHGANVNARTRFGQTPLHFAIPGSINVTEELLQSGADPNAKDNGGKTPVDVHGGSIMEPILRRYAKSTITHG